MQFALTSYLILILTAALARWTALLVISGTVSTVSEAAIELSRKKTVETVRIPGASAGHRAEASV
jgi:hypothetical protein